MNLHDHIASLTKAGALPSPLQALLERFVPEGDSPLQNPFQERKGRLALALAGENIINNLKIEDKVVIGNEATWEALPQNVRFFLSLHSLMVNLSETQMTQVLGGMLSKEILLNIDQFSTGDAYMSFSVPKEKPEAEAEAKKSDKRRRS